jgi:XTP/dITP diphosphohydrolase
MKKPNLLLATNNHGKVAEMQALLEGLPLELVTPLSIGLELDVPENGETYAENATVKAEAFARASGLVSLADDSGLEVDALEGRPGLHSHRFAPQPNATDADRRRHLLLNLTGKPRPWTARFRATVAVTVPGQGTRLVVGTCEGEIIPQERGSNGFGYDPLFLIPEFGRTMAELTMDEKNRLSHRARAVNNAIPILKEIFGI